MELTKGQLIKLVERILNPKEKEEELDYLIDIVEKNAPDPNVSYLLFWNEEELSVKEVLDSVTDEMLVMGVHMARGSERFIKQRNWAAIILLKKPIVEVKPSACLMCS